MDKQKYYKIVANFDDKLESACRNWCFPNKYRVYYKKDVEVFPVVEGTKLFVFDDLGCARGFANRLSDYRIEVWECTITNPTDDIHLFSVDEVEYYLNAVLHGDDINIDSIPTIDIPNGTIGVDSVTLICKVE